MTACSGCTSIRRRSQQGLPHDFLIWWRGDEGIADIEGGSQPGGARWPCSRTCSTRCWSPSGAPRSAGSHSVDFSLFSLPIATQAVYSVLLMIPVGALVIVLLRNFVGVKTFGTFMPVLVALAFRETLLLWGIAAVRGHRFARPADPLLPGEAAVAARAAPHVRADGRRAADGGDQRAQPQARPAARPVDRAVPDGHHLDDDRAHVDRLGGARRIGGDPGGRRAACSSLPSPTWSWASRLARAPGRSCFRSCCCW